MTPHSPINQNSTLQYQHILFDWGNTLMADINGASGPMYLWPDVFAINGASELLQTLSHSAQCHIATNANDSDSAAIRNALQRVKLDQWIQKIFCSKEIGFKKPDIQFYRYVIDALDTDPSKIIMIGDSLENDVLAAKSAGIEAIWYNPKTEKTPTGIISVSSLTDILTLLKTKHFL